MTAMKRLRGGWVLGALGMSLISAGTAIGAVPIERPGSLLLFPKVVNDASRRTVIEITNTGNSLQSVKCFYIEGSSCQSVDFELTLTRQQPTYWSVGEGRRNSWSDSSGGLDPGPVPPVGPSFEGALVCATVDPTDPGILWADSKLTGSATLEGLGGGGESRYNAIPVYAGADAGGTNEAELDGDIPTTYADCPQDFHAGVVSQTSDLAVLGANVSVATRLTFLSCDLDFYRQSGGSLNFSYELINEFEQRLSGARSFDSCWFSAEVSELDFGDEPAVTQYNALVIKGPSSGGTGAVGVVEDFAAVVGTGLYSSAARTLHDITPADQYPDSTVVVPPY